MTSNQNNNGAQMGASGDAGKLGLNLQAGAFVPSTTSTSQSNMSMKIDSVGFTPQMNTEVTSFTPSATTSFNQSASFYPGQNAMPQPAAPSYDAGNNFQGQNNFYQTQNQFGQNGNFGGNQQNFYNQQNQFNQFNQYGAQQQQYQQYPQQNSMNFGANSQSFGAGADFNNGGQQMYNNQNNGGFNQSFNGGNQYQNKMNGGMSKPYNNGPQQYQNQGASGYQKNNNSYNGGMNNQSYNQGPTQYKKKEQPVSYNNNQNSYQQNNKYEERKSYNSGMNNTSGDFSGWQAPAGQKNSMAHGKIKNVVTGNTTMKPMSLAATPFKLGGASFSPFVPKPADVVADNLKKFDVTDEEEVKSYKGYLKELKKCIDENNGVISLDLFKNLGDLKLCKLETGINNSSNKSYVKRTPEMLEQTKKQGHGKYPRRPQGQGNNQGGGEGNFDRDKRPKPQNQNNQSYSPWLQVDTEEKRALQEQAKKYADKIKTGVKNDTQKIKLILNIIAPDNKEKKFGELRQYLFKGLKTPEECEDEGIEYIESEHKLVDGSNQMNDEILEMIVSNIIRKAQVEKEYCIFYGELCERKIQLELKLRGDSVKISNMKNSLFRKQLFNVCKICFEKFFDAEEREKNKKDLESTLKFQEKLFGNIEFVGELYRRKILPQSTLISVFESLLGMSDVNDKLDDLILEGAINLMNKVGEAFEKNTNQVKKNQEESQQAFKKIINRFEWAMNLEGEDLISNRIKLLVKNMFQNRKDGWTKTHEMNKGGPKTKSEVQKEVEDKYKAESQARNQRDGNRGYGNDNRNRDGYNNDRNKDKNYNDGGRRDQKPQYQKKGDNQGGGSYGNGGRENRDAQKNNQRKGDPKRNEAAPKQEVIPLDDDEMGNLLKKNFEDYANKKKMADEGNVEEEEDKQEVSADLSMYEKFKTENGKSPSLILFSLLCKIFDEDMQKVDNYFSGYLDAIVQKKTFSSRDFGEGISKFVQFMPEIVLDVPQVHQYLWKNVIDPLSRKNLLKLKFIKWTADPKDKPAAEDEDDIVFDATDSQLKLMALLIKDYKNGEKDGPRSWNDVFKWVDVELKLWKVIKDKQEKIEDGDDLWAAIGDDVGSDLAPVIIPMLKDKKAEAEKAAK